MSYIYFRTREDCDIDFEVEIERYESQLKNIDSFFNDKHPVKKRWFRVNILGYTYDKIITFTGETINHSEVEYKLIEAIIKKRRKSVVEDLKWLKQNKPKNEKEKIWK